MQHRGTLLTLMLRVTQMPFSATSLLNPEALQQLSVLDFGYVDVWYLQHQGRLCTEVYYQTHEHLEHVGL